MVTVICNVFINSNEKFDLFKQTFPRVYDISDNWLINIRGKYRDDILKYIKTDYVNVEKNCIFFSGLDSRDWAKSTQKMLEKSKYDYVYVFLEDHFLLKPLDYFRKVILDMRKNNIDYFQYSFFNVGLHTNSMENDYPEFTDFFYSFTLQQNRIEEMKRKHRYFFPYSLASISSKEYFLSILRLEKKILVRPIVFLQEILEKTILKYPNNRKFWFILNKFFKNLNIRFVLYPPSTPFNIEKSLFDMDGSLMPIKIGVLRDELFSNWDDDNGVSDSSLIKRGLYPLCFRADFVNDPPSPDLLREYYQPRGKSLMFRYYPDKPRITKVPLKYIFVKHGAMQISSLSETISIKKNEQVWVAANIPHSITAQEDCWYYVYIKD